MVKGTIELTEKLVGMESRYPPAETPCALGFVRFVDPELAAHLLDKIVNFVGVHREGFNNWPQLTF
jgi:hypothetical protein